MKGRFHSQQKDDIKAKMKLISKNGSLQNQVNSLKKKNKELEKKLQQIDEIQNKKIMELKQSFAEILKVKEEEYLQKYLQKNQEIISFPQEVFTRYPMLEDMIHSSIGSKPTDDFVNFCKLFFLLDKKSYAHLADFMQIIPERTMFDAYTSQRNIKRHELTYVNAIPYVLGKTFNDDNENIHITLGGDAASVKLIPESDNSAIYTFMAIPLKKILKPLSLYVMPTKNGASGKKIVQISKYITNIIEQNSRFIVDFVATDGDTGFDCIHPDFFLIEPILKENISFLEKIQKMINFLHIPINDPLHLMKNGRSHLLNHPLMIDPQTL